MSGVTLVVRNLGRHRLRTCLTVGSVAVSLFLFTLLWAVTEAMGRIADDSAAQSRLVVHHKSTMTQLLPLRVGQTIGSIDGVRATCGVRWFGGRLDNSNEQFPSLAAETDAFATVYSDFGLSDEVLDAWRRERTAAVVGAGLASRMGWRPGHRATLRSTVPPYLPLDFRIVGVTETDAYQNVFAFRLEYLLEELRGDPGTPAEYADAVNFYWVKLEAGASLDEVAGLIDARTSSTTSRTRSESEQAFVAGFSTLFGDVPRKLVALGLAAIASSLLAVGSSVLMSIRERAAELSVLKVLGFPTRRIIGGVVAEAALLGLTGGLIGGLPALATLARVGQSGLMIPYFPSVAPSPAVAAVGALAGLSIGLVASVIPVIRIARAPAVVALRDP